jgi:hypothetical protein
MSPETPSTELERFFVDAPHKPINRWHHYFPIYHRYFDPLRAKPLVVLEIGVYKGGSLQMWKSYFSKGTRLIGVDVNPACERHADCGAEIFIGDSADKDLWSRVIASSGPLDIVIDDGGHTSQQQINAFEMLYPAVRDGGVYLVEDTHTSFWPAYIDTPDGRTFLQFAHEKTLELHGWTSQFDLLMPRFNTAPAERVGECHASEFCRSTSAIHFYDSVVVFEKRSRQEPYYQELGIPE